MPAGRVVCSICWERIPRDIRAAVRRAHTFWVGDPTDQNWATYMRARRDALTAITR